MYSCRTDALPYPLSSLPSQDLPHYYDPESCSDDDTPAPPTTNRGHKLLASARHVRRGRLGSYPHTDLGFAPSSASKRQKKLDGASLPLQAGFSIAPNFHLLRSYQDESLAPPALPSPAQTPLDLLLSPALQHTLGAKNQTFKTLAMSATGLIEQEGDLIGSLRRVCSGVRGEGYEWRWEGDEERKVKREKERADEREIEDERERLDEEERARREEAERLRVEEEDAREEERRIQEEEERHMAELEQLRLEDEEAEKLAIIERAAHAAEEELQRKREEEAKTAALVASVPEVEDANVDPLLLPSTNLPSENAMDTTPDGPAEGLEVKPAELVLQPLPSEAVLALDNASLPPLPSLPEIPANIVPNPTFELLVTVDPLEPAPTAPLAEPTEGASAEGETSLTAPIYGQGDEMHEDSPEEPLTRRRSGRVASRFPEAGAGNGTPLDQRKRSGSTSSSSSDVISGRTTAAASTSNAVARELGPARKRRIQEEEMPEYATRLVDPEIYVRSLLVSEGDVEMEVGGNGGTEILSPNEQEVMVHDCLVDLHRFLADSLEYRSRLSEIRDGVLGVERRRKGLWKVVRMVAADWLEEEQQAQENE